MDAIQQTSDGVLLRIKVVPQASRTELAGFHGDTVRIRVSATPVDGAANRELLRFLAELLAVPRSAVHLRSGAGSRSKLVSVSGVRADQVYPRLSQP